MCTTRPMMLELATLPSYLIDCNMWISLSHMQKSGLSMIVPAKSADSALMFLKPFTWEMWVVIVSILIYTMLIVWYLERDSSPEFSGPWKNQLSTAMWFTFSSLFYAHREKIHSNFTRVVISVWLFLVMILTSSYTASLSSMLTVKQLQPNVTDIEWLKRTNSKIGCDGDSFVRTYLEKVQGLKTDNIINVSSEYNYPLEFKNNSIVAAFLELPYEKVFINRYCKGYTSSTPSNRYGGLAFIFQKGSPIVRDFSKAISQLSENGQLTALEEEWLSPSHECATSGSAGSLSIQSFWLLFVISGATSTICFLLSMIRSLRNHHQYQETDNDSVREKEGRLEKYIYNGENMNPGTAPSLTHVPEVNEDSLRQENVRQIDDLGQNQNSPHIELEILSSPPTEIESQSPSPNSQAL
ncbi:Glutamate receptor [Quillaja saponaria]|uniref:Glutamate receptor n=1 Tax=Quillaja saponaria TaxID=32244 RepID=A0AAD7M2A2_QUISA|nr:Glutamate receptor [Quillaja saponaria]